MPTHFVILHHRVPDSEHWDFMLEYGDVLLTWQLPREPTGPKSLPMPARRIADHRKKYLDYEGPISENRGTVVQFDRGAVQIGEVTASRCRFTVESGPWKGQFRFVHHSGAEWTLDYDQDACHSGIVRCA